MEVCELHAISSECVHVWGVDVGSVAAELGEACVVKEHDHHVGCGLARVGWLYVVRLGVRERPADRSLELAHRISLFRR